MAWLEILLIGAIIGGALYLLYRSLWHKRGFCPGCDSRTCPSRTAPQASKSINELKGAD